MARGYVYFVHAPEVSRIKIGWSAEHPDVRLAALRTGSPVVLERMGFLRGKSSLENQMHARFRKHRLQREWFHAGPDLLEFIAERTHPWDIRIESSKEDRQRSRDDLYQLEVLFGEWYKEYFGIGLTGKQPLSFAELCAQRGVQFTQVLPPALIRRVRHGEPAPSP